jgi:hypothetical protein
VDAVRGGSLDDFTMICALHAPLRLHISRFITAAASGAKAHTSGGRK